MEEKKTISTVRRLIVMKQETRDRYAQDLARLEQIVSSALAEYEKTVESENLFIDEIRVIESDDHMLSGSDMIERRAYLIHLHALSQESDHALKRVERQRDQAHHLLENLHKEIRSLERLIERRMDRIRLQEQRTEYLIVDDMEISGRTFGVNHVYH